jgi:DNA polymerase elongation subunit (family B)
MSKNYLAFDIETVPLPWESFSESQQEYIIRRAETEEDEQRMKDEMALTPLTAQVICIGMQMIEENNDGSFEIKNKAAYAVDNTLDDETKNTETLALGDTCYLTSEKRMLEDFWKILAKYPKINLVSFNGRNFDAPFVMLRSGILKVKPSRNIMSGTKFNYQNHIDLIDELTFFSPSFYGATKRFNFDFYARTFGIKSPKSEDIDGSKVKEYFAEGRILEIADYCLRDVTATWELYLHWREYLAF